MRRIRNKQPFANDDIPVGRWKGIPKSGNTVLTAIVGREGYQLRVMLLQDLNVFSHFL
jgi:hypothetical protein